MKEGNPLGLQSNLLISFMMLWDNVGNTFCVCLESGCHIYVMDLAPIEESIFSCSSCFHIEVFVYKSRYEDNKSRRKAHNRNIDFSL